MRLISHIRQMSVQSLLSDRFQNRVVSLSDKPDPEVLPELFVLGAFGRQDLPERGRVAVCREKPRMCYHEILVRSSGRQTAFLIQIDVRCLIGVRVG